MSLLYLCPLSGMNSSLEVTAGVATTTSGVVICVTQGKARLSSNWARSGMLIEYLALNQTRRSEG